MFLNSTAPSLPHLFIDARLLFPSINIVFPLLLNLSKASVHAERNNKIRICLGRPHTSCNYARICQTNINYSSSLSIASPVAVSRWH